MSAQGTAGSCSFEASPAGPPGSRGPWAWGVGPRGSAALEKKGAGQSLPSIRTMTKEQPAALAQCCMCRSASTRDAARSAFTSALPITNLTMTGHGFEPQHRSKKVFNSVPSLVISPSKFVKPVPYGGLQDFWPPDPTLCKSV